MSGSATGPSRWLRLVLRAYPPAWRAEHAEEMATVLADRGGRRLQPGDVADLLVRGVLARWRRLPRLVPALAVAMAIAAAWTASWVAGPWTSLHLLWGSALTGMALVFALTAIYTSRRRHAATASGSRWVRTGCALSATAVVVAPLILSAYLVGERLGWWNDTAVDLVVRSAALLAPPDAVFAALMACAGLLGSVWLTRTRSWRGPALAAAAALALSSWFAQLRDLASPPASGISFGFTPFAEVLRSHALYLHGLPGLLILTSLAVTTVCAIVPAHRDRPATAGKATNAR